MRWLLIHPGPNFSVADVHNGWAEALTALGEHVLTYNLDQRLQFYDSALVETGVHDEDGRPQMRRAFTRDKAVEMAAAGLLSTCYQFWPDVVVATSAFFTPPWVLDVIRKRRHKIVMLFTESPYQDEMQLRMAEYADLCLLNDPVNIGTYRKVGRAEYMPHAYRPAVHCPGPAIPDLKCDLAFAGTAYPSRIAFFEAMGLDGLDVLLAGNWMGIDPASPLMPFIAHDLDQCVDNTGAVNMYRSAKCGINVYRREAEDGHVGEGWAMGPREVELAATGLFFLRDSRPEGDGVFPMLPTFGSAEDAGEQLRWWLAHDEVREKAAHEARLAVADRTFENNAKALMRLITEG